MMDEGEGGKNLLPKTDTTEADEENSYRDWDICIVFNNVDEPRDKNGNPLPQSSKAYKEWFRIPLNGFH